MSERFMENIRVSAEVKTYLKELYNQIEYELRDDYKDSLEKTTNILTELEEYLNQKLIQHDLHEYQKLAYQNISLRIKELKEKYK